MPTALHLSIVDNNYGNRLQAYAIRSVLKSIGFSSIVSAKFSDTKQYSRYLPIACVRMIRESIAAKRMAGNAQSTSPKAAAFKSFSDDYAPYVSMRSKAFEHSNYDAIIIGSDQCWNPSFDMGSRPDGAQCAHLFRARCKVAYAASFGIEFDAMSEEWRERYARWLSELGEGAISVREDAGAEIVRNLCGFNVPVVLDPTMLLTAEDWEKVERAADAESAGKTDYCLKYVLGDDAEGAAIEALCNKRGLRLITIGKEEPFGPSEFLWLIHHASLVCTDSFHAAVFSMLFHSPFLLFERKQSGVKNMSSRLDTLGRLFGIDDHRFAGELFDWEAVWHCDWNEISCKLKQERSNSLRWLDSALSEIEKNGATL